jgi:cyclopropane fatty-acyl-phospholipid synthase-like methyltransferase
MFRELKEISKRPKPFQFYTASELWTNEHTSKKMLEFHLNETIDAASRNKDFIERSVDWIVSKFEVKRNTKIADFGCGPGLYTTMLAERGAGVTGIDFSSNSLEYAKQAAARKGLTINYVLKITINYVLKNYLEYKSTSRFDLIIMIMCDFCALSPDQRKKLLSKFKSLLKPNGSVLIDVYSLNYFNLKEESASYELNNSSGFWSPKDYYCFVNTFKYDKEKVLLDKYTIIEESRTPVKTLLKVNLRRMVLR